MKIGKYEVTGQIAEGYFAMVLEAVEPAPPHGLGRKVAIKLCWTTDEDLRRRFAREAEMIAKLGQQANITSAYDLGFHEGAPYLVQEYLSGEDLRDKIQRGERMLLSDQLSCLLQVAKGLQFAHSRGIVHRDIKPENIRLLENGQVKLMDFGVGKVIAGEVTRLTREGTILGTLGYLAPEQLHGRVDERSDIFAYAVVAFELVSLRHPFAAETLKEQYRVLREEEPPPLAELCPSCPKPLARLIHACLAKHPQNRPQTFEEIVAELRKILRQLQLSGVESRGDVEASRETMVLKRPMAIVTPPAEERSETSKTAPAPPRPVPDAKAAQRAWTALRELPWPSIPSPAGWPRPTLYGAAASATVLILALLAWALWPQAPVTDVVDLPEVKAPAIEPATPETRSPMGHVFVDAFPWGELLRVLQAPVGQTGIPPVAAAAGPESGALGSETDPADEPPVDPWADPGLEVDAPLPCVSPCRLELPPGTYRLVLASPEFPDIEPSCEIAVVAGVTSVCRVRFTDMTPIEFFKETGWWG